MAQNQVKCAQIGRRRRALNVCLLPEADIRLPKFEHPILADIPSFSERINPH